MKPMGSQIVTVSWLHPGKTQIYGEAPALFFFQANLDPCRSVHEQELICHDLHGQQYPRQTWKVNGASYWLPVGV